MSLSGLIILLGLGVLSQTVTQAVPTPTLDQLADAMKAYFRDSTELPLRQEVTYTVLDSTGRIKKASKGSVEYMFKGYSRRKKSYEGEGTVTSLGQMLWGLEIVKAAINSDASWVLGVAVMFSDQAAKSDASVRYLFRVKQRSSPDSPMTVELTPGGACPPLTMQQHSDYYLFDNECGPVEIKLEEDLSLQSFAIEEGGLPAEVKIKPFGRTVLRRYSVQAEFHKVMLPGDSQPLIIPKHVTTSLETTKGNIVITSDYAPRSQADKY